MMKSDDDKYEVPMAKRLGDSQVAHGNACDPRGSAAGGSCASDGSSADSCTGFGNTADTTCAGNGSSADSCVTFGGSPTQQCIGDGSGVGS